MAGGTVGVVGLGLIGGSVALDGRADGWPLLCTDTDPEQRAAAAAAGVPVTADLGEVAGVADVVVVATPAPQVGAVVATLDAAAVRPLVATSVASVQGASALGLDAAALQRTEHLGGHPMTGTERSGFRAARRGMFDGSPWIVTPEADTTAGAFRSVVDLALALGAVPVVLAPEEHDRTVALLSHLPHVLAYTLYGRLVADDALGTEPLAGGSFRDATRVAATRPSFWADVLTRNRDAVADLVAAARADLAEVEALLRDGADEAAVEGWLARGHRRVGRPRPETPAPLPVPADPAAPLGPALLERLRGHTHVGLGIDGWTADGAVRWSAL